MDRTALVFAGAPRPQRTGHHTNNGRLRVAVCGEVVDRATLVGSVGSHRRERRTASPE